MVIIQAVFKILWRITMNNATPAVKAPPLIGRFEGGDSIKIKDALRKSWAHDFRQNVLPFLPAHEIGEEIFCTDNGRPSNDVTTYIGLMIIQQRNNLSDNETVEALRYDTQVQHALGIDSVTDKSAFMCLKSFWSFKEQVRTMGLHDVIFNKVTMNQVNKFKVDTSYVRMDSVNIKSNMKLLTRATLFRTTICHFLKDLKKNNREAFNTIDGSLTSQYFKKKTGYEYFAGTKPTERHALLKSMAEDVDILVRKFQNDEMVSKMESFQLLNRLFGDQCNIIPASDDNPVEKVELKDPKEVQADSLQSPHDPSAGYCPHKKEGRHQSQFVENFTNPKTKAEDGSEKGLSLILHVKTESAAEHDSHAVEPAINDLKAKGVEVDVLLADTAYGGDENVELAKSHGIKLVSPVPGNKVDEKVDSTAQAPEGGDLEASDTADVDESGTVGVDDPAKRYSLADFERDENGKIISCPMGQEARTCDNKAGTGFSSTFNWETCQNCPCKNGCPVRVGKRKASINYTTKDIRIAERRRDHETPQFKMLYRMRSGIEATNSEFARRYKGKRLRVRGEKAVTCTVAFKVLALNSNRIAAYNARKRK
jgi:hypothetical protein